MKVGKSERIPPFGFCFTVWKAFYINNRSNDFMMLEWIGEHVLVCYNRKDEVIRLMGEVP